VLTNSGNLLLTDVYERYYVDLEYGEEYRGVYLIRGENVVLVGELVKNRILSLILFMSLLIFLFFHRMKKNSKQFQRGWQNLNVH
jgi:hypothetical protein